MANKVNPLVTKHTGMYPRRQQTDSKSDTSALGLGVDGNIGENNQSMISNKGNQLVCECATR